MLFRSDVKYIALNKASRSLVRISYPGTDILHSVHQYPLIKWMIFARINLLTIHDINFIYEKEGEELEKYSRRFGEKMARANHLTYISNFAKNDVERIFGKQPQKSDVIHNGVADLSHLGKKDYMPELGSNFFFHISSLLPKKNPHLLIEMMKYLPDEKLVIAGNWSGENGQNLKDLIREHNITNIIALDSISTEEKAELFKRCKAFFFPSLCEGFGLPPLEAMLFGKQVFLSNLTSLPEVGSDKAHYWDNLTPEIMAEKVRSVFENNHLIDTDEIINWARTFSWKDCAEKYISLYLKLLKISY